MLIVAVLGSTVIVAAQDLAQAADKARQGREKRPKGLAPPKTYTNEDLSGRDAQEPADSAGANAATPAAEAPPDREALARARRSRESEERERGESSSESAESSGEDGDGEGARPTERFGAWKEKLRAAQQQQDEAEASLKATQDELTQVNGQVLLSSDTNEILSLQQQQRDLQQQLDAARVAADQARQQNSRVQEEARRSGVPANLPR